MLWRIIGAGLVILAGGFSNAAVAQDDAGQDDLAAAKAFVAKLDFKEGQVAVPEAQATFKLKDGFRYLAKADAKKVLEDLWGNPPSDDVLGLIVPKTPPLYDAESWAVVVQWDDDGYVSDEDAAEIDYGEMLRDLQAGARESNDERKKAGYPTVDIVGWAEPPRYDKGTAKLYWARELNFEGAEQHTLNYEVRVLGRRGVLSLEAVANMSEMPQVRRGMQDLLTMAEFDAGARYADFDSSSDKVAGYGVAALIGGVAAKKLGLFAGLGVLLLKAKKLLILLFIGAAALVRKLFGKKDATPKP